RRVVTSAALRPTATAATRATQLLVQCRQLRCIALRGVELGDDEQLAQCGKLVLEGAPLGLEQLVRADRGEELPVPVAPDRADPAADLGKRHHSGGGLECRL